jgi:hypothetical protein
VPSVPSSSAAPFPQLHPSQIQLDVPFIISAVQSPKALDDVWASKASRGGPAAFQPHIITSGVVPGASQWSSEFAPLINTPQLEVNGVGGVQPTGTGNLLPGLRNVGVDILCIKDKYSPP